MSGRSRRTPPAGGAPGAMVGIAVAVFIPLTVLVATAGVSSPDLPAAASPEPGTSVAIPPPVTATSERPPAERSAEASAEAEIRLFASASIASLEASVAAVASDDASAGDRARGEDPPDDAGGPPDRGRRGGGGGDRGGGQSPPSEPPLDPGQPSSPPSASGGGSDDGVSLDPTPGPSGPDGDGGTPPGHGGTAPGRGGTPPGPANHGWSGSSGSSSRGTSSAPHSGWSKPQPSSGHRWKGGGTPPGLAKKR